MSKVKFYLPYKRNGEAISAEVQALAMDLAMESLRRNGKNIRVTYSANEGQRNDINDYNKNGGNPPQISGLNQAKVLENCNHLIQKGKYCVQPIATMKYDDSMNACPLTAQSINEDITAAETWSKEDNNNTLLVWTNQDNQNRAAIGGGVANHLYANGSPGQYEIDAAQVSLVDNFEKEISAFLEAAKQAAYHFYNAKTDVSKQKKAAHDLNTLMSHLTSAEKNQLETFHTDDLKKKGKIADIIKKSPKEAQQQEQGQQEEGQQQHKAVASKTKTKERITPANLQKATKKLTGYKAEGMSLSHPSSGRQHTFSEDGATQTLSFLASESNADVVTAMIKAQFEVESAQGGAPTDISIRSIVIDGMNVDPQMIADIAQKVGYRNINVGGVLYPNKNQRAATMRLSTAEFTKKMEKLIRKANKHRAENPHTVEELLGEGTFPDSLKKQLLARILGNIKTGWTLATDPDNLQDLSTQEVSAILSKINRKQFGQAYHLRDEKTVKNLSRLLQPEVFARAIQGSDLSAKQKLQAFDRAIKFQTANSTAKQSYQYLKFIQDGIDRAQSYDMRKKTQFNKLFKLNNESGSDDKELCRKTLSHLTGQNIPNKFPVDDFKNIIIDIIKGMTPESIEKRFDLTHESTKEILKQTLDKEVYEALPSVKGAAEQLAEQEARQRAVVTDAAKEAAAKGKEKTETAEQLAEQATETMKAAAPTANDDLMTVIGKFKGLDYEQYVKQTIKEYIDKNYKGKQYRNNRDKRRVQGPLTKKVIEQIKEMRSTDAKEYKRSITGSNLSEKQKGEAVAIFDKYTEETDAGEDIIVQKIKSIISKHNASIQKRRSHLKRSKLSVARRVSRSGGGSKVLGSNKEKVRKKAQRAKKKKQKSENNDGQSNEPPPPSPQ